MASFNETFSMFDADVIGIDFLFMLPEIFLALSLSSLLVFGACVHNIKTGGKTAIFRDVVCSLSIYTAFLTLSIGLFSP